MATGTGNLPNPGMSFTPFDILTAAEQNDLVENIESLATGTGIGDGSVDTAAIADEAVTADKLDFTTLNFGNYSTSEVNTGFTYYDGKPIFKRTFTGTISAATNTRGTVNLATGVENVVDTEGWFTAGDGSKQQVLGTHMNAAGTSEFNRSYVLLASGTVTLGTISDNTRTNSPYAVTILYTKV